MPSAPRPYWPDFPTPKNVPTTLPLEGYLDVYEYARRVFLRILAFRTRKDFDDLSSEEIRDFLVSQQWEMVCTPHPAPDIP